MGPKCLFQGQHNVTCLREKPLKDVIELSYEISSSSAPPDFPSIPMPPFPSFIEPFKPTFETGNGSDPNADSIVKGNAFDLLQYDYQSNHNVLFELTGFEGIKYYNQFDEIYPIENLDLLQFRDLLKLHFRQTCIIEPTKEGITSNSTVLVQSNHDHRSIRYRVM